jgi:hypothetical protein
MEGFQNSKIEGNCFQQLEEINFNISFHFELNNTKTLRLVETILKPLSFPVIETILKMINTFFLLRPHIYNLNFDPQLSCRIVHIIQKPETSIGNRKGHESDICMVGPG